MSVFDVIRYTIGDPVAVALPLILWGLLGVLFALLKYRAERLMSIPSDDSEQYEVVGFGDDGEMIYAHEKPKREENNQ